VIEYQRAENAALLERFGKHRLRLTDGERRLLAKLGKALGRNALQEGATLAMPDTIPRRDRELVAAKYDDSKKHGPGRPNKKAAEIERLLLEMAKRNPTWGYTRLRDAMNNVGYDIGDERSSTSVEHGLRPPRRGLRGGSVDQSDCQVVATRARTSRGRCGPASTAPRVRGAATLAGQPPSRTSDHRRGSCTWPGPRACGRAQDRIGLD
jgi:hypothetical protein